MNILLIDIECTCDDVSPPPREEMETIEIGAVMGNLSDDGFTVSDELQIYIKPEYHPVLSKFCTDLTGIEQATVDQGISTELAFTELEQWIGSHSPKAWSSWGKFDCNQLKMEADLKSIRDPLNDLKHLNMKQLFAKKRKHRVGLRKAVELSKLEFIGRHHSGIDDARNIASLLAHDTLLREAVLSRV